VTSDSLEGPCSELKQKLKHEFSKNLDKFEIYANRNIFVLADSASGAPVVPIDVVSASSELISLREQYLTLREQHEAASAEAADCEGILASMKTALFNVRVGAQTLDAHNVPSLVETAAQLARFKADVVALTRRANDLTKAVVGVNPSSVGAGEGSSSSSSPSRAAKPVKTGDTATLKRLAHAMDE